MNKRIHFIAIHGQMRAGKDEVAGQIIGLINHRHYHPRTTHHAERLANADILKEVAGRIFSIPPDKVFDESFKLETTNVRDLDGNILTWRQLLQKFGGLCRKMMPDCWVRAMVTEAMRLQTSDIYVVSDCRYPNEFEYLRKVGDVTVVCVKRPGFDGDNHGSERSLDSWTDDDFVIMNDGDLESLYTKAQDVARKILERISVCS